MTEYITLEEKAAKNYRFAGFWMRFWAYLLDLLIIFSIQTIIISPVISLTRLGEIKLFVFSFESILLTIIAFAYFIILTKI